MAQGKETMVRVNSQDDVAPDALKLGRKTSMASSVETKEELELQDPVHNQEDKTAPNLVIHSICG